MLLKPSQHQAAAKAYLEQTHKPGRVILIHTGVNMLVLLLLTVADYLLDQQIGTTGGLSGIGMRSILETAQSVLRLIQLIALPFWQLGYTYYALRVAKGEQASLSDLTQGFRRFGPILRLKALMVGMTFLLAFVCSYASSFIFMMTPWSKPMMREIQAMIATGLDEAAMTEAIVALTADSIVPILIIFSLCFLAGGAFLFFRFRLAELWLMDHPEDGARAALRGSRQLMRGNWKGMLRIDLSFWWFYLLEVLLAVLYYGDVILEAVGIEMTIDAFSAYILFFALYLWGQMALYWWKQNELAVTYAHAYVSLCPQDANEEAAKALQAPPAPSAEEGAGVS